MERATVRAEAERDPGRGVIVPRALRVAGRALLVAGAVDAVGWFVWTVWAGLNPVPIHDQWTIFAAWEKPVRAWLSARNGHVLFFARLLYALDIRAAHGTGYLLTCSAVLCEAALAFLALRLVRQGGASGDALLLAGACTAPIAFGAVDFFNYVYGFMVHWWLSMVGVVGAVAAVAGLARAGRRGRWARVAAALAGATVAALSMGTGFLAFAAVAVLALAVPARGSVRRALVVPACAGVALYTWAYLWGRTPVGGAGSLGEAVAFSTALLGAPLANALLAGLDLGTRVAPGDEAAFLLALGRGIGIAGVALAAACGVSAWWRAREPARTPLRALSIVQLWVVVTSLAVYRTRAGLGPAQAMAIQYWPAATLFWITVPACAVLGTRAARRAPRTIAAGALLLLAAALLRSQPRFLDWARSIRDGQYRSAAMLAAGVSDRPLLELTFHPDHAEVDRWRDVEWLRARRAGPFVEPWLDRLGSRLDARAPGPERARCAGGVTGAPAWIAAGAHSGWRLSGWAVRGPGGPPLARLVLADAAGAAVGFGWAGASWSSPPGSPADAGGAIGWTAYAPGAVSGSVKVYAYGDEGPAGLCPLGVVELPVRGPSGLP